MPAPRTLRILALLALAGLVLSAGLTRLRTNDLFIHLVTGGLILDELEIPSTDRYSYTAPGARYVTHEWLAATIYALGERAAGPIGAIVASKTLPGLAILAALLAAYRRSDVSPAIGTAVATVALTVAHNRMTQDRPEVMAIALLLALLWLLLRDRERAGAGAPDRWLFAAAPLLAVWANVHASFPLGIALVAAFAAGDRIDALLRDRDERTRTVAGIGLAVGLALAAALTELSPNSFSLPSALAVAAVAALFAADAFTPLFRSDSPPIPEARRYTRQLLAVGAAMLLAIALNPQGFEIYLFPFEFTAGVNTVTENVGEWRPFFEASFLSDTSELAAYSTYLALWCGALGLGAARGVLDRREIGILLLFGILPLRHIRWMGLFALLTAPALAALLSRVARAETAADAGRLRRSVAATFAAAGVALLGGLLWRLATHPFDGLFIAVVALGLGSAALAWTVAWRNDPAAPVLRGPLVAASALCAALAGIGVASGIPGRQGLEYQRGFQWRDFDRVAGNLVDAAPAIAFMRQHGIEGQLLTEYPWAGYAIHQLWPDVTVFVDSRSEVYGEELLEMLLTMPYAPALTERAIEQYGTDLVLVGSRGFPYDDREQYNAGIVDVVIDDPDWALLYFDDAAVLFARQDTDRTEPLPSALEGLDPRKLTPRTLGEADPDREAVLREAVRRAPGASLPRFALASLLHARGASGAAMEQLEAAWRANPAQPAAASLAGRIAEDAGDHEAARRWYDRTLEAAPTWQPIRARRRALAP